MRDVSTFQGLILALQTYWAEQGCVLLQPNDMEVGAGDLSPCDLSARYWPRTVERGLCAALAPPTDGRYGDNPNRLQHYYQYQVVIKPSPLDLQNLYLGSLQYLGLDPLIHDIRFVEDNWESPTLGAWGLGWEVWLNGMKSPSSPIFSRSVGWTANRSPAKYTVWSGSPCTCKAWKASSIWSGPTDRLGQIDGDVFHQNEVEMSTYNFERRHCGIVCGSTPVNQRVNGSSNWVCRCPPTK